MTNKKICRHVTTDCGKSSKNKADQRCNKVDVFSLGESPHGR